MANDSHQGYKKKRKRVDIGVWIISIFILLYWIGSLESPDLKKSEPKADVKQIQSEAIVRFSCPTSYLDKNSKDYCAENHSVELLNWRVSAKDVTRVSSYFGKEICFNVKLENLDKEARDFSESDFRLRWPSGQVHDFWTDFSTSGTLDSAPLASGGYATGKVCFKDPREKGEYMLIFKPSFESERGIWFYNLS